MSVKRDLVLCKPKGPGLHTFSGVKRDLVSVKRDLVLLSQNNIINTNYWHTLFVRRDRNAQCSTRDAYKGVKRDLVSVKRDLVLRTLFVRRDRNGMAQCSTRDAYTGRKGPLLDELMKTNAPYPSAVT